jgi:hypothetical protein
MTVQEALLQHFRELLMPRNQGAIAVTEMFPVKVIANTVATVPPRRREQRGFVVCLGHDPFMEVVIDDLTITLYIAYPQAITVWDDRKQEWQIGCGEIKKLPTSPKARKEVVSKLSYCRVAKCSKASFEIVAPDSLQRAEFIIQTTITRIKYMVSNKGYFGLKPKHMVMDKVSRTFVPKDSTEFTDLLELATQEYTRISLKNSRKKGKAPCGSVSGSTTPSATTISR